MTPATENVLTNKLSVKPEFINNFADWQAQLNAAIAAQPGFVSLEILSPILPEQPEWLIIQRFYTSEYVADWHHSEVRKKLMKELEKYADGSREDSIQEVLSDANKMQGGVTEVFITQVRHENEKAYRAWTAKIHQAEAKFPGFRGVYIQSPSQSGGLNWITMLQFDNPENLDRWLDSPERQKVLEEGKGLISSLDTHRMVSPYAGWFASIAKKGMLPPVWKQTMIVLLVLFPIVMFELKYLTPWTSEMNRSLGTFIGNAISVALISWPMMPIAILFLGWWLAPKPEKYLQATIAGTFVMLLLYLIEIVVFWKFL